MYPKFSSKSARKGNLKIKFKKTRENILLLFLSARNENDRVPQ